MSNGRRGLIQFFSLIAVFSLSACGGGDGNGSGAVTGEKNSCFDNGIYAANAVTKVEYIESGRASGTRTEIGSIFSTNASFNSVEGLIGRQISIEGTSQLGDLNSRTTSNIASYIKLQDSGVPLQYGSIAHGRAGIQRTLVYTPAYEDARSTLTPGGELTFSMAGTDTTTGPVPSGPTPFSQTTRVKFVGVESLQLPSGNYQACRYDVSVNGSAATKEWLYRGLVIRTESPTGNIFEMKSGTLNNVPI
jgi:hypothetical protein